MPTPIIAANAYAALAKLNDPAASIGGLGKEQDAGPSFNNVLKDVIDAVSEAAQKSDAQAQAVANGKGVMACGRFGCPSGWALAAPLAVGRTCGGCTRWALPT